jgi:hypothetical protein
MLKVAAAEALKAVTSMAPALMAAEAQWVAEAPWAAVMQPVAETPRAAVTQPVVEALRAELASSAPAASSKLPGIFRDRRAVPTRARLLK